MQENTSDLDFPQKRSPLLTYLYAIGFVALVSLARTQLHTVLGDSAPLMPFLIAVLLSAAVGGIGPGLLATMLSATLGEFFFIEPYYTFYVEPGAPRVQLVIFIVLGMVISILAASVGGKLPEKSTPEPPARDTHEPEHLRSALASFPDGVITTDRRGNVVYLNRAAEELTGWSEEEAIEQPLGEIVHLIQARSGERIPVLSARALRNGRIIEWPQQTLLVRKDGQTLSIEDQALPIRSAGEELSGCILIIRKYAPKTHSAPDQKTLAAMPELLQPWVADSPLMLSLLDDGFRFLQVNNAHAEFTGVPSELHFGKTVRELMPEWADELEPALRCVLQTGEPLLGLEYAGERNDGFRHDLLAHLYPVRSSSGAVKTVGCALVEITDRKQAERATLAAEARFRALLETSEELVWLAGRDGLIRYVTPSVQKLLGYSTTEFADHTPFSYLHPDDMVDAEQRWKALLRSPGAKLQLECRFRHHDGSWRQLAGTLHNATRDQSVRGIIGRFVEAKEAVEPPPSSLVWISGIDRYRTWFTRSWLDFVGPAEDGANSWAEHVHPDDFYACLDAYMKSFDEGAEFELRYRLRRSDGEYRSMVDRGIPLFSASGELSGYIGCCIDVSDASYDSSPLHSLRDNSIDWNVALDQRAAGSQMAADHREGPRLLKSGAKL